MNKVKFCYDWSYSQNWAKLLLKSSPGLVKATGQVFRLELH